VTRRFSAVVLAALVLAPSAAAVRVHVRVEGAKTTIWGTTAPLVDVQANALDALEAASGIGEFYYHVQRTSFGPYVDQIGRNPGAGTAGWVFKVDGKSPPVGADAVTLKDGDTVLWYWAQFGAAGGPKTLSLERMAPLHEGIELIVGARTDLRFGPVAMVGIGGIHAEVFEDIAIDLAPLDVVAAERLLRSLRGAPLLAGVRGRAPLDVGAAARAAAALSRVAAARPDVAEIEVNPLLVTPSGAVALDARVIVRKEGAGDAD